MAVETSSLEHEDAAPQHMLSAISNEMVRLYKERFGRGPTKTRTNWAGSDVLVVTLEETFTPAERSLRRMGEHQELRDLRMLFQYASVDEFCEPVERLTGRRVTPSSAASTPRPTSRRSCSCCTRAVMRAPREPRSRERTADDRASRSWPRRRAARTEGPTDTVQAPIAPRVLEARSAERRGSRDRTGAVSPERGRAKRA